MPSNDPPVLPVFLATIAVFVLLTLSTFSFPIIPSIYLLHTSQNGGMKFGLWGWCLDQDKSCLQPIHLGYAWEPQIAPNITKAHVFYPISTILTLIALMSYFPVMCNRTSKYDRIFSYLILVTFLMTSVAFVFTIAIWSVAQSRFRAAGIEATLGSLPWMAMAATLMLFILTLHSGCGTLSRLRRGPYAPRPYRY